MSIAFLISSMTYYIIIRRFVIWFQQSRTYIFTFSIVLFLLGQR